MTATGSESLDHVQDRLRVDAEQWEREKRDHAARLYGFLTDLVGDVEVLRHTSAFLSWRTAAGVQGQWREEGGQFWLGRIVWTEDGRQSEQLVLTVETAGDGADRTGLAHPLTHHWRLADGPVRSWDPETPQRYEEAQALLTQLAEEGRTMLPPRMQGQEDAPQEDRS